MYVTRVPNRGSPPAVLLRETYRENGKVKTRTLANLSRWPEHKVDKLQRALKGLPAARDLSEAFEITRSLPHGHVAAVLGSARRLGIEELIDPTPSRRRDLVIAAACGAFVAAMVGMSYAAVPLYSWFCRTTGFGGTPIITKATGQTTDIMYIGFGSSTLQSAAITDYLTRVVQPLMAILFAIRDGRRDARDGRTAYLWSLFTDPVERRYLLESGWKGISKVFVLAFGLDVVYQFMVLHGLKPLQALLTAIVLAVIPYAVLRGPVNRITRIGEAHKSRG